MLRRMRALSQLFDSAPATPKHITAHGESKAMATRLKMRIKPADGFACLSFMIQPPPLYAASMHLPSERRTRGVVFAGAKMDCGSRRRSDDEIRG